MKFYNEITVDGVSNLHIDRIDVFTGKDEYCESDCYQIENNGGELNFVHCEPGAPSDARLNEVSCRVILTEESGTRRFCLTILHHKGHVYQDFEEI